MKTDVKRIYFRNQYNLKAQIACCDNGQYCLTRYSYPRPLMNNEVVEQHMTDTISEAFAIMDSIYKDEFAMMECSCEEFMDAFKEEDFVDCRDYSVIAWSWDERVGEYNPYIVSDECTFPEAETIFVELEPTKDEPQIDLYFDDGEMREKIAIKEWYSEGDTYEEWL